MKTTQLIRLVTFLLIFSLFIIAALIAIIFAQGRTLNEDGTITQTSIVRITSVPQDIEVFLDGKKVTLTDSKIEWIEPGLRTIKITKSGYKDWEKTLKLEAGIVKDIFAQLYPDTVKFTKLTETSIDKIIYSDNSEFAYYTVLNSQNASQNGLWRLKLSRNFLDFGNNTPILISNLTEHLEMLKSNNYDLVISSDNNKILLKIPNKNILSSIEVSRQNQDKNIVSLLGYYPDKVYWFRGSESIVVEKNNLLFEYELSTGQKSLIDFSFDNKLLYSVNSNFVLFQNTQDKKLYSYSNKFSVLFDDKSITDDLSTLTGFETIPGSKEILILKFPNSFTYVNIEKKFVEDIADVESIKMVSSNGRVILFERDGKLVTYSLENTPDNQSFISAQNIIEIDQSLISRIYFTPNNKNILFKLLNSKEDYSIISYDIDGENLTEIIKDPRIDSKNNFAVSGDSTNMYIALNEQVQETLITTNLHELDLVVN